jgi:hypothetical protein
VLFKLPEEDALDWSSPPFLSQRTQWTEDSERNKPILARTRINYELGFHGARGYADLLPDSKLLLVHFHRIDYTLTKQRHAAFAKYAWNEHEKRLLLSDHQLIHEGDAFDRWYYNGTGAARGANFDGVHLIPDVFRTAV